MGTSNRRARAVRRARPAAVLALCAVTVGIIATGILALGSGGGIAEPRRSGVELRQGDVPVAIVGTGAVMERVGHAGNGRVRVRITGVATLDCAIPGGAEDDCADGAHLVGATTLRRPTGEYAAFLHAGAAIKPLGRPTPDGSQAIVVEGDVRAEDVASRWLSRRWEPPAEPESERPLLLLLGAALLGAVALVVLLLGAAVRLWRNGTEEYSGWRELSVLLVGALTIAAGLAAAAVAFHLPSRSVIGGAAGVELVLSGLVLVGWRELRALRA